MPDVCLRRVDDDWFEVSAQADQALAPGISVRFFLDAHDKVPAAEVERVMASLVEATLHQLAAVDPRRAEGVRARWRQPLERRTEIMGRLGVEEEELGAEDEQTLASLAGRADWREITAIAEGIHTRPLQSRVAMAEQAWSGVPPRVPSTPTWRRLQRFSRERHEKPWLAGWTAAERVRDALQLSGTHVFRAKLGQFLEEGCGWPVQHQLEVLAGPVDRIDTLHVCDPDGLPIVMTTRLQAEAQRFRLAKALYYAFFGSRLVTREPFVDSFMLPLHSEANAFAAELLAPAAYVHRCIPVGGVWEPEDVDKLATDLAVSPRVVRHQIENRRLGALSAEA